ncbi:ATP-binding cassette domain-containing protein [Spiroplasma turonicum]|uniref:ABC transporter domain-containing protein n=1 Tax=Spiroplasma turonicum TaxID=216946 RepID=A0A0K1P6M9_9MOLU|nr:ATP-binding cassette domain-containing protein [Spiroplasma turonicum]AKU79976.1 hypothetical protein STURON_00730 [Spiroplasma turonicum]
MAKFFGYLGPNGDGKSTTIRTIHGFIKSSSGSIDVSLNSENQVNNIIWNDSWKDANKINRKVCYVPGEISFPLNITGIELIRQIYSLRNLNNRNYVIELIKYCDLYATVKIKKLSKGNK